MKNYLSNIFIAIFLLGSIGFTFTNCDQEFGSSFNEKPYIVVAYLGSDGLPYEEKTSFKIVNEFVVINGDVIVGKVDDLYEGGKVILNYADAGKFGYNVELLETNNQKVVSLRSLKANGSNIWPQGRVPFKISEEFSDEDVDKIIGLVNHFNEKMRNNLTGNKINVELIPWSGEEKYFKFKYDADLLDACFASVGYPVDEYFNQDKQGFMLLGPNCFGSTFNHELLHILGIKHEHQRWDRNEYVEIHWGHIKSNKEGNFKRIKGAFNDTDYDYSSIMQYSSKAFRKDGSSSNYTITKKGKVGGERIIKFNNKLSKSDYKGLLTIYNQENDSVSAPTPDNLGEPIVKPYVKYSGRLYYFTIANYCQISSGKVKSYEKGAKNLGLYQDFAFASDLFRSLAKGKKALSGLTCNNVPVPHDLNQGLTGKPPVPFKPPVTSKPPIGPNLNGLFIKNKQYMRHGFYGKVYKYLGVNSVCRVRDKNFKGIVFVEQSKIDALILLGGGLVNIRMCTGKETVSLPVVPVENISSVKCNSYSRTSLELQWKREKNTNIRYRLFKDGRKIKDNLDALSFWDPNVNQSSHQYKLQLIDSGKVVKEHKVRCPK